jgi:hypothetical protein
MTKKCTKCKVIHTLDNFTINTNHLDGLEYMCKDCKRDANQKRKSRDYIEKASKVCTKCNEMKLPEMFSNCSSCYDSLKPSCKECVSINEYKKNRTKILDKKRGKPYIKPSLEKTREYKKRYLVKNRNKVKEYANKYSTERRKVDPLYKLTCDTRSLIGGAFRKYVDNNRIKSFKTEEILGCNFESFIKHLQQLFTEEMTLENHGNCEDCLHIDHKIPVSSAKTE